MTGDPHSEPLTPEQEQVVSAALETLYMGGPPYDVFKKIGRPILRSMVRDVVGPMSRHHEMCDQTLNARIAHLQAALTASEASAEELRREVARLNTVTAWYEEKHRQRRAQVYAAEASAQRLTEALGKLYDFLDNTGTWHEHGQDRSRMDWCLTNEEYAALDAIDVECRAALDEAQKVAQKKGGTE